MYAGIITDDQQTPLNSIIRELKKNNIEFKHKIQDIKYINLNELKRYTPDN